MINRIVIIIIIIIMGLSFFSCKQQEASILFFEQKNLSTIIPLDSASIYKQDGLRKIKIKDEKLLNLINRLANNEFENNRNYSLDVRYKISIDSLSIYLGYGGDYLTSKGQSGKIDFIDFIEKYVRENQKSSILITKPLPILLLE